MVDDDAALRFDLAATMSAWGYDVKTAGSGKQAIDVLDDWQPDLILCDVQMPDGNGFQFAQFLRTEEREFGDIGFLFMSSLRDPKIIVSGIRAGADDYITKPVELALLNAKIKSNLRRRSAIVEKAGLVALNEASTHALLSSVAVLAVGGLVGFGVLLILYFIKSELGINFFEDMHFRDLFWS